MYVISMYIYSCPRVWGYMGDWFKNALGIWKSMGTLIHFYKWVLIQLPSIATGFMGASLTLFASHWKSKYGKYLASVALEPEDFYLSITQDKCFQFLTQYLRCDLPF